MKLKAMKLVNFEVRSFGVRLSNRREHPLSDAARLRIERGIRKFMDATPATPPKEK